MKEGGILRDLWENIKGTNICIGGFRREKERHKWVENITEDIAEKFLTHGKTKQKQI